MTAISSQEQIKFMLSCFRNANPGKIDWKIVAEECGIISIGAAQKRWERLNKADAAQSTGGDGAGNGGDPGSVAASKGKSEGGGRGKGKGKGKNGSKAEGEGAGAGAGAAGKNAKKRKIQATEQDEDDDDEDVMTFFGKNKSLIKDEDDEI